MNLQNDAYRPKLFDKSFNRNQNEQREIVKYGESVRQRFHARKSFVLTKLQQLQYGYRSERAVANPQHFERPDFKMTKNQLYK